MEGGGKIDFRQCGVHDVADASQEFTAEAATWVVASEVHGFEVECGDQRDGECVTHCHGGEGRGRRREIIWTYLAFHGDIKPDIRMLGQGRLAVTGHGDDFVAERL